MPEQKPKTKKVRLDALLVDRGLVENRSRAQALVMAGKVFSNEQKLDKAGKQVSEDIPLEVRGQDHPWVSRGGLKLAHGLKCFEVEPADMICVDVGASTGGFTDVLLQNDALRVYAVDVGHGQLAWKLRSDDRVVVMERCNARYLTADDISDPIDLIVCDASFIGLRTVLPAVMTLAKPGAGLIALIKPQFEVGKGRVGKGGVVRDSVQHEEVCEMIRHWVDDLPDWHSIGLEVSPITGPEGNKEFLIYGLKDNEV